MANASVTSVSAGPVPDSTALKRNWVWLCFQRFFQLFFAVWLRYRARGVDRLPNEGPALLLSNHQSFLDPLLIGLPLRRPISFLARDSLFRIPVIGSILRATYVVPLNREGASAGGLRETIRRLEQGFLVGVFPEGTRSRGNQLGAIKPGFAALVRRSDAPLFPVGVAGADRALGRGSWFLKPCRVCVVYGEPFPPDLVQQLRQRGREQELVEEVRRRIADCQHEAEDWLRR